MFSQITSLNLQIYLLFYPLFESQKNTNSFTLCSSNHQHKIDSEFTPLVVDAESVVEAIIILNKIERN